jgi:hypothetical protein
MEITMKRLLVLTTLVSLCAMGASPLIAQEAPASTEHACDNCLAVPAPAAKAMRDIAASMVKSTEEVKTSLATMIKSMEDMKTSVAATVTKAVEDVKTSILGNSCECDVPHENK